MRERERERERENIYTNQYPETFIIETVLGCNLSCPECAVGGGLIKRQYGYLSYSDFVKICTKIRNYCKYLYLHLWGEPMLNPEIIKMIKYANQFTKTNISTNANTLNEKKIEEIVNSGVSDIIVSIDGMSQDCYSLYRRGGGMYIVRFNRYLYLSPIQKHQNYINFFKR